MNLNGCSLTRAHTLSQFTYRNCRLSVNLSDNETEDICQFPWFSFNILRRLRFTHPLKYKSDEMLELQWRAEAVGCPGSTRFLQWMPSKIFSIRPAKFLTTFFLSVVKFQDNSRSLDAPSRAASCPGNDIFLFIFCHLPTFSFYKNWPLGCPQGGCPGPSHRPHPPLHATVELRLADIVFNCFTHNSTVHRPTVLTKQGRPLKEFNSKN